MPTTGTVTKQRGSLNYNIPVVESGWWVNYPTPNSTFHDVLVNFPKGLYEKITYENPQKSRSGNCHHIKIRGTPHGGLYVGPLGGQDAFITECAYLANYCDVPSWIVVDWSAEAAEAYIVMKPSLSSSFSLSNFLIELVELKLLFKLWKRSKTIVSNIASGYLNLEFGWKLMCRDLMVLWQKLSDMQSTLADYRSKQGRMLVRHYKRNLPVQKLELEKVWSWGPNLTNAVRHSVYHATMRYSYVVPRIDSEYANIRGILDVLGLKANVSVVWDAIPFSFVVDWFLGVGNYLRSLDTDFLESVVTIHDFCSSVKTETSCDLSFAYSGGPVKNVYTVSETEYKRLVHLPNASDFGIRSTGRYGTKQIVLSAALLSK